MRSKEANQLKFILKYMVKPLQAKTPVNPATMRRIKKLLDFGATYTVAKVPKFVSIENVNAGGTPAEWVIAGDQRKNDNVLLYIHGGGYFFGCPKTHRQITWRLSHMAKVKVLSIDYQLLPDHSMGDCWEDAFNSYKWLLSEGYKPEKIIIGGDSAGGGLTLSTLFRLKDNGLPLPLVAFLISPFADIRGDSHTLKDNAKNDHMFHIKMMSRLQQYLSKQYDNNDYYLSPVLGDYKDFPPLFIQVSDTELLYGDALRVKEKAEAAGVDVEFDEWKNMPHVFTAFSNMVPEAKEALNKIADFITGHLHVSNADTVYHCMKQ